MSARVRFNELRLAHLDLGALVARYDVVWLDVPDDRRKELLAALARDTGTAAVKDPAGGYLALLEKGASATLRFPDGVTPHRQDAAALRRRDEALLARLMLRALPRVAKSLLGPDLPVGLERGLYYYAGRFTNEKKALRAVRVDVVDESGRLFLALRQRPFLQRSLLSEKERAGRAAFRLEGGRFILVSDAKAREEDYCEGAFGRRLLHRVPFYDESGYRQSKVGVAARFLRDFNRAWEGVCGLALVEGDEAARWRRKRKLFGTEEMARRYLEKPWCIVVVEEEMAGDAEKIAEELKRLRGEAPRIAKRVDPEAFNLLLHFDKERYEGRADPYARLRREHPDANLSSLTPEALDKSFKDAIGVVAKEAVVKEDLRRGKLSAPWVGKDLVFGYAFYADKGKKLPVTHLLRVAPDGALEHTGDFPGPAGIADEAVREALAAAGTGVPFIVDPARGVRFLLRPLPKHPMPDLDALERYHEGRERAKAFKTQDAARKLALAEEYAARAVLSPAQKKAFMQAVVRPWIEGGKLGRSSEAKKFDAFLRERHGLRFTAAGLRGEGGLLYWQKGILYEPGQKEYYAGTAQNLRDAIQNAPKVRRIETNAEEVPEWFWETMEVGFVKNKDYTVLPFPFKHLREAIRRWHLFEAADTLGEDLVTLETIFAKMYA